jgi:hypothetical protein
MGFAAVCLVEGEGMKTVDKIYQGYGEKAGRDQASIQTKGNAYLRQNYPQLDYIKTARLADGDAPKPGDDQSADVEASATPSAAAAPKAAAPKAAAAKAEKAAPLAETKETGGGTGKGKGKGKGDGSGQGDGSGKGSQGD